MGGATTPISTLSGDSGDGFSDFQSPQPNTTPLYRCYDASRTHHFASNQADCEGQGTMEWLLGYALQY